MHPRPRILSQVRLYARAAWEECVIRMETCGCSGEVTAYLHSCWGLCNITTQAVMLLHLTLTRHTAVGVLDKVFLACL